MARRRKYTDAERAMCIETGSLDTFKRARYCFLRQDFDNPVYGAQFYLPDYDVARCLFRSELQKGVRLRKRLKGMISSGAWFLTLTFTDSVLASTDAQSRRKYVRRFLKEIAQEFIANKDYGGLNGREHYTCVIALPYSLDCFVLTHDVNGAHPVVVGWNYGFTNWERIGKRHLNEESQLRAISKYVTKLQFHALKESASSEMMIFSRKARK